MTATATFEVTRVATAEHQTFKDVIAVEEPLQLSVAYDGREQNISVTMRTPGDDFDLAVGFLFTEGLIRSAEVVDSIRHWGSPNRVRVALKERLDTSRLDRHFYATSSCGVCGKASIDAIRASAKPVTARRVPASLIASGAAALSNAQTSFRATGGVHGAALIDFDGTLLRVREDVGRHNAVDKVIGSYLREQKPMQDTLLVVSSRAGFEIVQKAVVAGIPAMISMGAPSSLAIELAREFNLALIGFVRDQRFNVYAGELA